MGNDRTFRPDWTVSPGEVLQEALDEREMSQADLCRMIGRSTKMINQIIKGKAPITPQTALQLESALGICARFWMSLESDYRLGLLRQDRGPIAPLAMNGDV